MLLGNAELDQVGVGADESLLVATGGQLGNDVLDSTVAVVRDGIQNNAVSHNTNPPNLFAAAFPAAFLYVSA